MRGQVPRCVLAGISIRFEFPAQSAAAVYSVLAACAACLHRGESPRMDSKENVPAHGVRIFQAAPAMTKAAASASQKPRKSLAPLTTPLPVTSNMVPTMTFKKSPKRSPVAAAKASAGTKSYARPSASSLAKARPPVGKAAAPTAPVPANIAFPKKAPGA